MQGHVLGIEKGIITHFGYRWWAERGMIHWEHVDTGDYGSLTVRVCLQRLEQLNKMVNNVRTGDRDPGKGENALAAAFGGGSDAQAAYIEDMVELCKIARVQGQPDDKSATRSLKRARPTTIVVPGAISGF